MKKILITGANGFIGTNFILNNIGKYRFIAISTNDTNLKNINDLEFIKLYLNEYNLMKDIIDHHKPDTILHLAWEGANSFQTTNSIDQFHNIKNSFYLLESLKKQKCHFIGMGTGAEYGCFDYAISERDIPSPTSHYGMAKYLLKQSSEIFCKQNNIPWSWIRPMFFYGKYDVHTRLIPKVIDMCLKKENIVLDSCTSENDYLYIDDVAIALSNLIDNETQGLFNLCSGRSYTTKYIVKIIMELTGWDKIEFDSSLNRVNFCKKIIANNMKISQSLNWQPKIDIHQGLSQVVEYHKKLIS